MDCRELYLDLMKRVLVNLTYRDVRIGLFEGENGFGSTIEEHCAHWPTIAHTMVGIERMHNVHRCLAAAVDDRVPGDFIETGVWQGGVCIFARALFKAYGIRDRSVWVADSFAGIPVTPPDGHPLDVLLKLHEKNDLLAVPRSKVEDNFRRYELLDDQVIFLEGWFHESLPRIPADQKFAVVRLDGDLYSSTTAALVNLYPRLSPGGFVIVDDYGIPGCAAAVHEFREANGIDDPIESIDYGSVFWRRSGAGVAALR